jgi:TRAP-type C4-dicarboxylate transport system substrate-binding protein
MPRCRYFRTTLSVLCLLAAGSAQAMDLKIATIAPDGSTWMQEMRRGAAQILQRTAGRVNFKFYPGGAMGNDKSVLRKIRAGQLQGGAVTSGALVEAYPDDQVYNLPLVFHSYEELDYVRGRMDSLITAGLEQHGFVSFGLTEGGFAYLMSSNPVHSVEALKKEKVWIPDGDLISRTLFESMGVSPIPLPLTDVLTGLQTGLITTVGASPSGAIALQWHTKVKYVTDVPVMYFYGALVVDTRSYSQIGAADQKVVHEVMGEVFDHLNRRTRQDNENARAALIKQGVEFLPLSPDELVKLNQSAERAIAQLGERGAYTAATYKILQEHLASYRKTTPKAASHH